MAHFIPNDLIEVELKTYIDELFRIRRQYLKVDADREAAVKACRKCFETLESQITSGTGADGKKLTVRELIGPCNSAAILARPLAASRQRRPRSDQEKTKSRQ